MIDSLARQHAATASGRGHGSALGRGTSSVADSPRTAGGIEVVTEGDGSRVVLWGEVDVTLRDQAGEAMTEVVMRGGPVVVDAGRVDFLDSTGLAFVLQLVNATREAGCSIVLRDPPETVVTLIDMVGLHDSIPVERREPSQPQHR